MNQRQEVMQAWDRYSKTAFRSPQFEKAKAFFEFVDQRTDICWDEFVAEVRRNYEDALEVIITVLLETDDPLMLYNVVHFADTGNPKEAAVVKTIIRQVDAQKHQVALLAAAQSPDMRPELQKKPQLTDNVRKAIGLKAPAKTAKNN